MLNQQFINLSQFYHFSLPLDPLRKSKYLNSRPLKMKKPIRNKVNVFWDFEDNQKAMWSLLSLSYDMYLQDYSPWERKTKTPTQSLPGKLDSLPEKNRAASSTCFSPLAIIFYSPS